MNGQTSFRIALKIQLRVIGALLMREVITRYGRHNLGFLWLFLEPVLFTSGIIILWSIIHQSDSFKVEIIPFVITGYSTLLLWRNCAFRGINSIEPNRSLLHHRNVRIIDIFAARMLLEIAGVTASFAVIFMVVIFVDLIEPPNNFALMLLGWSFMAWFSANLGVILGCLSEYTDLVERLWHPISYFMLSVSGMFFMVDWLSSSFQKIVLWVPMVHATEMLRFGYYGPITPEYYSIFYITTFCAIMSLCALLLIRDTRLRIESSR